MGVHANEMARLEAKQSTRQSHLAPGVHGMSEFGDEQT